MAIPPRQIGWSQESNLLWEISKTLDFIQGNVSGLQGQITLTTTGNSGPATLVNNILNIPEYTIEGLGGVPETRTITINGETHDLSTDVSYTVLGQAVTVVLNYSGLPAPSTVPNAFYWVEESQGTYWLPGSMGGTFYNAGLYYSNGVEWQFMETPWQATQIEVDAGVNFTKFVTPLTLGAAAKWSTKTEWKGVWQQQQYTINQQVIDEGYLAIANKTTSQRPSPQRVGEPFNIYQGTIGSAVATAKQVIFGNKYTFLENVFFEGWRINVVAGNRYTVYLVRDPDGENVISQIIQFVAQSSGWVNLSAQSLIINAGNTYAVIAAVTEPTIVPVTFNGNWNISQPQNITVPGSGQITQPRSDPGELYINNLDQAAVDRSVQLASLEIGDVIKTGTNTWAIQSVSIQPGYFIFGVSPALLNVNIGVQNFIFEETSEATLTYPLDPNYWALNPSTIATVQGLLGIDIPYQAIVPDTTAYGIGVLLQTLVTSADWDIQAYSGIGGGGSGGGASSLDDLTDVEILTPLDAQILTYEAASSLWKNKPAPISGVPLSRTLTINGVTFDLSANRVWNVGDVLTTGSYANPSWITSLAWSKITGTPTTLAGYGITDAVSATRTININGNTFDLSSNREWRVAQADTGALTFAGMAFNSTTAINIGALTGYVINNETNPAIPTYTFINYPGVTGITVPTVGSGPATYVLIQSNGSGGGTPVFQNTFPTSAQRKSMIWLGKVSHPQSVITVVLNEPDYILSPQAFARDLFQALGPYINENVYPSPAGANLNVAVSAGNIYGDGINFVNDRTNPNKLVFPALNPITLSYRTQIGTGAGPQFPVITNFYDVNGVTTAIPGGPNVSTLQYFWVVTGAVNAVIVQYGQTLYNSLDAAKAAVGKEVNVIFPNLLGNAILIGVLAVRSGATVLNNINDAQFFKADKLGQIGAAGGGSGVGTSPITIIISTIAGVTNITTATTDVSGYGQDGRNVVIDNFQALTLTCNGGVTATYARHSANGVTVPPAITFVAGAGRTLIQVDGNNIFNGAPGSTAALWTAPGTTIDYLRISNA